MAALWPNDNRWQLCFFRWYAIFIVDHYSTERSNSFYRS